MLARVAVAVSVVNLPLGVALIAPFALMALPGAIYGAWLWFRRHPGAAAVTAPQIGNPLNLKTAIKFARTATGRTDILFCSHAFHGLTYGGLSLNGDDIFRNMNGAVAAGTDFRDVVLGRPGDRP